MKKIFLAFRRCDLNSRELPKKNRMKSFAVAHGEIMTIRSLWNFVPRTRWNKINPPTLAGISYAVGIFHARSAFHKSTKWICFIEKSTLSRAFFLYKPHEKEIFGISAERFSRSEKASENTRRKCSRNQHFRGAHEVRYQGVESPRFIFSLSALSIFGFEVRFERKYEKHAILHNYWVYNKKRHCCLNHEVQTPMVFSCLFGGQTRVPAEIFFLIAALNFIKF